MLATPALKVKLIASEFRQLISELSLKECVTLLGMLNEITYCAALNAKVIVRNKNGRTFNPENILDLINKPVTVVTPVKYLAEYLKTYWAGLAYCSRTAVYRLREMLCETFKLFTLERRDWSNPAQRHRAPNPCADLDFIGALILARELEDRALTWYKLEEIRLDWSQPIGNGNYPTVRDETRSLPAHKGYTTVRLYNLVFEGIDRWGREEWDFAGREPAPEVVEAVSARYRVLQAETRFAELLDAGPERDPELVLITETLDVQEPEIIEPNGTAVCTDKTTASIPLVQLVRYTRKIPPKIRSLCQKAEQTVAVPAWALSRSGKALEWWQERISGSGIWFSQLAPDWVLDTVLPF